MAALVLDASVVLAVALQEENRRLAAPILARVAEAGAVVPGIWHLEVGNVLLLAERRRMITAEERAIALDELAKLPIATDNETALRAWRETAELAARHKLTMYDAAHLELSLRRGLPLATFDAALRRAAGVAGVALVGG